MPPRYRVSGLVVHSEIAIPAALVLDAPAAQADVTVAYGVVPGALAKVDFAGPNFQVGPEGFLLSIPNVARFLIRGGREIVVEPAAGVRDGDIALFLAGSVFGILVHQRGAIALHASAVAVNGRAVAFCGRSGAGKSTLAAALGGRGYAFVNDDLCVVTLDGAGHPMLHPDGRVHKLWQDAVEALAVADRQGAAVRGVLNKYYVAPRSADPGVTPLAAIYVLREARVPEPGGIERLNPVDAMIALRANAYRPRLIEAMGQRAAYFAQCAAIAGAAPLFRLSRPWALGELPATLDRLVDHWREQGF